MKSIRLYTSTELVEERRMRGKTNNAMQATSSIESSIVRNPNAIARIEPVQYVSMEKNAYFNTDVLQESNKEFTDVGCAFQYSERILNRSDSYMSLLKYEGDSEVEAPEENATDIEQNKPTELESNWIKTYWLNDFDPILIFDNV